MTVAGLRPPATVVTLPTPRTVATPPTAPADRARSRRRVALRVERLAVFGVPLAIYLVLGALLAFRYHSYVGDAQSRLANAYYILYSRDPHLAAIGFVWNPGTSFAELPLLLLKPLFPALASEAFAANIVSALAMAGAGYQLWRFLEEQGVQRLGRLALLTLFVGNPMVLIYGANGMSEALFTFSVVATARYLAQWLRTGGTRWLVISGVALGWAYIVRNEAVAAAGFAALVVIAVTFHRASGSDRERRLAAATDLALFIGPFALAFAGWAAVSWVIVGHPFEQFSSVYGTASQLKLGAATAVAGKPLVNLWYVVRAVEWLAPFLPLLLLLAIWRAWLVRDAALLAVLSVVGGVVAFEVAAYSFGQIRWSLRYVIYAVPLAIMLAGCIAASDRRKPGPGGVPRPSPVLQAGRRQYSLSGFVSVVVALVLVAPGVATTAHADLYTSIGNDDQFQLNWILFPATKAARTNDRQHNWASVRQEAQRLDAMHLHDGQIMVDNFDPCVPQLVLLSDHPKQFNIPNDEDFVERLGAPYENGVRYLLVTPDKGEGAADALNRQWGPSLYSSGAGIARPLRNVKMVGCPAFVLEKLVPTAP